MVAEPFFVGQEYKTTVSETTAAGIEIKNVDEGTSRAVDLRQIDAALGTVIENRVLTAPGAPEKRHIGPCSTYIRLTLYSSCVAEFELPAGMTSRAGDYLAM